MSEVTHLTLDVPNGKLLHVVAGIGFGLLCAQAFLGETASESDISILVAAVAMALIERSIEIEKPIEIKEKKYRYPKLNVLVPIL